MGKPEKLIAKVFCFADFSLDVSQRTLHRGEVEVDLRPKCFDLLVFLASRAGTVVAKSELIEAVWPDVVVTDESLTRCVSDIRQALGDGGQRIVKTVPRRGYVLAAEVSFVAALSSQLPAYPLDSLEAALSSPSSAAPDPALPNRAPGWTKFRLAQGMSFAAATIVVCAAAWMSTGNTAFDGRADHLQASASPIAARQRLSIAVLPLASYGGNPDQADFAEGLTDDLTTDLSRVPGSFVVGRGSANVYKDKAEARDLRQVGRELGVGYLLEGSVQRVADLVRLNLRLIDAQSGGELWADRRDSRSHHLGELRSWATGTVAHTLFVEMMGAEARRSRILRPANPDAMDLVLQGFSAMQRFTPESNAMSRDLMQRAVAIRPDSAKAWAGIALTYISEVENRWVGGTARDESLIRAEQAAERARALDPDGQFTYSSQARALLLRGKPEQALPIAQRVVTRSPSFAPGWFSVSLAYADLGKPDESISASREALRLSPRDGRLHVFFSTIAAASLYAGRDADALNWAKQSIAARPENGIAHAWAAAAAANLGDMATARSALAEFKRLQPDATVATFQAERHGDNIDFLRQRERFYQGLRTAGLA